MRNMSVKSAKNQEKSKKHSWAESRYIYKEYISTDQDEMYILFVHVQIYFKKHL